MRARGLWVLVATLALGACGQDSAPRASSTASPIAFPSQPAGRLDIAYPLDGTLFPPEIVAPAFVWQDETGGVTRWEILLRFADGDDSLRFTASESGWRPSETRKSR